MHDARECRRNRGVDCTQRRRLRREDEFAHPVEVLVVERRFAGQTPVQDATDSPDVGRGADQLGLRELLRRHVLRRSQDLRHPRELGYALVAKLLCNAEVEELDDGFISPSGEEDVRGLEIAVRDPRSMSGRQSRAVPRMMVTSSSFESGPRRSRVERSSPSRYSMTMKTRPSGSWSTSRTCTQFGCAIFAAARPSRMKRSRATASSFFGSGILIATCSSRKRCRAR
jgi:hypothetical protein